MNQIGLRLFQLVDTSCIKVAVEFLLLVSLQMLQGRWEGQMVIESCSLSRRQVHLKDTAVQMPLL